MTKERAQKLWEKHGKYADRWSINWELIADKLKLATPKVFIRELAGYDRWVSWEICKQRAIKAGLEANRIATE